MSMSVPALELRTDADLILLVRAIRESLFGFVSKENCDALLSEIVEKHDRDFFKLGPDSERFFGLYRNIRMRDKSDEWARTVEPKYDFVSIEGRLFMLSPNGLSKRWKDLLMGSPTVFENVIQDYSFFNASDSQVSSGELSYDEWRERSDFWFRNVNEISDSPLLSYKVLKSDEVIPAESFFVDALREAPYAQMRSRRETLAKNVLMERILNDSMEEGKEATIDSYFRIINRIIAEDYPGWEKVEPELPDLAVLSLN